MLNVPVHAPVSSSQSPRAVSPSTTPSPVVLPLPPVTVQVSLPSALILLYRVKRSPPRVALPVAAPCVTDISSRYFSPHTLLLKVVRNSPAHSASKGYRPNSARLVEDWSAGASLGGLAERKKGSVSILFLLQAKSINSDPFSPFVK